MKLICNTYIITTFHIRLIVKGSTTRSKLIRIGITIERLLIFRDVFNSSELFLLLEHVSLEGLDKVPANAHSLEYVHIGNLVQKGNALLDVVLLVV